MFFVFPIGYFLYHEKKWFTVFFQISCYILIFLWYNVIRFILIQLGYKKISLIDGVYATTTGLFFYFAPPFTSSEFKITASFFEFFFDLLFFHFTFKIFTRFRRMLFTEGKEIFILGTEWSADGGHWILQIQGLKGYELFKEKAKSSGAIGKTIPHIRVLQPVEEYQRYYIPFIQYGVVGKASQNEAQLDKVYKQTYNDFDEHYNSIYSSCQEFCSMFLSNLNIQFGISDFKETLLILIASMAWYRFFIGPIFFSI